MTKSENVKRSNEVNNVFAISIGIFLLIEGVWGLFSDVVFGIFTTNITHAVIHIILGILGVVLGFRKNAGGFCTFLGILLVLVGLFRFVSGTGEFLIKVLNINEPVAYLNIIVGLISLSVVYYRRPGVLKN